ncbi:LexA family protein [Mucisphaera sp.]|uniref:LexA family protein n=1 Tax=Mucisphaera sp. TaxID=2913024 RepID=UPI003D096132
MKRRLLQLTLRTFLPRRPKPLHRRSNGRIRLQPANDKYEPIIIEAGSVQIQGVVIGVVRAY